MNNAQTMYEHLADLYRVAFWLTGSQEMSVVMAIDAFDSLSDPFDLLQAPIRAGLRKTLIERALAAKLEQCRLSRESAAF